jgi:hypothetical protein
MNHGFSLGIINRVNRSNRNAELIAGNNLANSRKRASKSRFRSRLSGGEFARFSANIYNGRCTNLMSTAFAPKPPRSRRSLRKARFKPVHRCLDVALQGDGFFVVHQPVNRSHAVGHLQDQLQTNFVTVNGNRLLGYANDEEFQSNNGACSDRSLSTKSELSATNNAVLEGICHQPVTSPRQRLWIARLGDASILVPILASSNPAPVPNEGLGSHLRRSTLGSHEGDVYRYFRLCRCQWNGSNRSEERRVMVQGADGNPNNSNYVEQSLPTISNGEYTRTRTVPNPTEQFDVVTTDLTRRPAL